MALKSGSANMAYKTSKARWCQDGTCHYDTYNGNNPVVLSWHIYKKFTQTNVHHFCELHITNLTSELCILCRLLPNFLFDF